MGPRRIVITAPGGLELYSAAPRKDLGPFVAPLLSGQGTLTSLLLLDLVSIQANQDPLSLIESFAVGRHGERCIVTGDAESDALSYWISALAWLVWLVSQDDTAM